MRCWRIARSPRLRRARGDSRPAAIALHGRALRGARARLDARATLVSRRRQRLDGLPARQQREDGSARAPGETARGVLLRRLVARRARLPLARQEACAQRDGVACTAGLPENRLWTKNGVVFATITSWSNDNRGFDAANDASSAAAGGQPRWLEGALASPRRGPPRPRDRDAGEPWNQPRKVYDASSRSGGGRAPLGKPVLFVHGDTHTFRADRPSATAAARWSRTRFAWRPSAARGGLGAGHGGPNDAKLFRIEPHAERRRQLAFLALRECSPCAWRGAALRRRRTHSCTCT